MDETIIRFRRDLEEKLPPMRYEHSLSVSYTCMNLAMRYGADLYRAELAGLMHDCAKRYDDMTNLQKCRKRGLEVTSEEERAPAVLHAKYGAWMLEHKYMIEDQEILDAVRCHTTGKPRMTLLEQILYVADYIEPRRYKAADLDDTRKIAWIDLDMATYRSIKSTLDYLRAKGCPVDSMTEAAYKYYRELTESKKEKE